MTHKLLALAFIAMTSLATAACNVGGGCGKDQTKVAEGGFCITIPAGYEYKGVEKKDDGQLQAVWLPQGGGMFDVEVFPGKEMPEDLKKVISHPPGHTVTEGTFADGKGKWVLAVDTKHYGIFRMNVKGPKGLIECALSADTTQMTKVMNVCKTITLM